MFSSKICIYIIRLAGCQVFKNKSSINKVKENIYAYVATNLMHRQIILTLFT